MSDTDSVHSQEEVKAPTDDLRNPDVVTKHKAAAGIATRALAAVVAAAVEGARAVELCALGDRLIEEEAAKVYNKKVDGAVPTKGVSFPTCVSVNAVVGCFSPANDDETVLVSGDLVKIDLGAHVDGYTAQAADTIVVGGGELSGRAADVVAATRVAADAVMRSLRPGVTNQELTAVIDKAAKSFDVRAVEGIYSHVVKRFESESTDGKKKIENGVPEKPATGDNKVAAFAVGPQDVMCFDIVMSTGTGRPREDEERATTVFRRSADKNVQLKLRASRAAFSEIIAKFPVYPFTSRALEMEGGKMRFALNSCVQHGLLESYPVLREKDGELVAHIKFTALVTATATHIVAGPASLDISGLKTEHEVTDPELKTALQTRQFGKKKKASKKKKKKSAQ